MYNKLNQETSCNVIQTSKTVEWLTNNTEVRTFNKVTFEGYQREVNKNHVNAIVQYIKKNDFYLPTSIICATTDKFNEDLKLYIVDGQHRIEAFKQIKEQDRELFERIKEYEISVNVLEKPTKKLEIETFITINKTSKKVDTSLALILKNKINKNNTAKELTILRQEYLAVELGIRLNDSKESIWYNKIILEGNPTPKTGETISLNAFVKSTKILIKYLDSYKAINLNWNSKEEFDQLLNDVVILFEFIWEKIVEKWPVLFDSQYKVDSVIQGTIGLSSINKYIILQIKREQKQMQDKEILKKYISDWIKYTNIKDVEWYKGNQLSKFSSESGFNLVANMLADSYEKY